MLTGFIPDGTLPLKFENAKINPITKEEFMAFREKFIDSLSTF
jgi:hypothetical protein